MEHTIKMQTVTMAIDNKSEIMLIHITIIKLKYQIELLITMATS